MFLEFLLFIFDLIWNIIAQLNKHTSFIYFSFLNSIYRIILIYMISLLTLRFFIMFRGSFGYFLLENVRNPKFNLYHHKDSTVVACQPNPTSLFAPSSLCLLGLSDTFWAYLPQYTAFWNKDDQSPRKIWLSIAELNHPQFIFRTRLCYSFMRIFVISLLLLALSNSLRSIRKRLSVGATKLFIFGNIWCQSVNHDGPLVEEILEVSIFH